MRSLLESLRERFIRPDSLAIAPLDGPVHPRSDERSLLPTGPTTRSSFTVHIDGSVSAVRLDRSSRVPALDSALLRAVDSLGAQRSIGPIVLPMPASPDEPRMQYADFSLEIGTSRDTSTFTLPLARVRFVEYASRQATLRRGNTAPPYPESMRSVGLMGHVLATFVVDENGMAEVSTFRALESVASEFTVAVRDHLHTMRFRPAEYGGCKVRMWVQQPFVFRLP